MANANVIVTIKTKLDQLHKNFGQRLDASIRGKPFEKKDTRTPAQKADDAIKATTANSRQARVLQTAAVGGGQFKKLTDEFDAFRQTSTKSVQQAREAKEKADDLLRQRASSVRAIRTAPIGSAAGQIPSKVEKDKRLANALNAQEKARDAAVLAGRGVKRESALAAATQVNYKELITSGKQLANVETSIAEAQKKGKITQEELGSLIGGTKKAREDLTAASKNYLRIRKQLGAATNEEQRVAALQKLASAQRRLNNAQENSRKTADGAKTTLRQYIAGIDDGTKKVSFFNRHQQNMSAGMITALGPLNGMAARFLALSGVMKRSGAWVATFVAGIAGLTVGFGKLLTASIAVTRELNKVGVRISTVANNTGENVQELTAYLKDLAYRGGINLVELSKGFSKIAIAAQGTVLQGEGIRKMFEDLTISMGYFEATADETAGVLKAFEQIISKGQVQAEELRGQLGDRLPGAFNAMARATGLTTAELNKALKAGQITTDHLPKFAEEIRKTFGAENINHIQNYTASQTRMKNAFDQFAREANKSLGVNKALAFSYEAIASALDKMAKYAHIFKGIGLGIALLATAAAVVALTAAIKAAYIWLVGTGGAIAALTVGIGAAFGALTGLAAAAVLVTLALSSLARADENFRVAERAEEASTAYARANLELRKTVKYKERLQQLEGSGFSEQSKDYYARTGQQPLTNREAIQARMIAVDKNQPVFDQAFRNAAAEVSRQQIFLSRAARTDPSILEGSISTFQGGKTAGTTVDTRSPLLREFHNALKARQQAYNNMVNNLTERGVRREEAEKYADGILVAIDRFKEYERTVVQTIDVNRKLAASQLHTVDQFEALASQLDKVNERENYFRQVEQSLLKDGLNVDEVRAYVDNLRKSITYREQELRILQRSAAWRKQEDMLKEAAAVRKGARAQREYAQALARRNTEESARAQGMQLGYKGPELESFVSRSVSNFAILQDAQNDAANKALEDYQTQANNMLDMNIKLSQSTITNAEQYSILSNEIQRVQEQEQKYLNIKKSLLATTDWHENVINNVIDLLRSEEEAYRKTYQAYQQKDANQVIQNRLKEAAALEKGGTAVKKLQESYARLNTQQQARNQGLSMGLEDAELENFVLRYTHAISLMQAATQTFAYTINNSLTTAISSVSRGFGDLATGTIKDFSFIRDAGRQLASTLVSEFLRVYVFRNLFESIGFGHLVAGGSGVFSIGAQASAQAASAGRGVGILGSGGHVNVGRQGLVQSAQHVEKFRKGGLLKRATMFRAMDGGMSMGGEAGVEAIMPLKRDAQGNLGVKAEGGGTTVIEMHIHGVTDAQSFMRSEGQIKRQARRSLGM